METERMALRQRKRDRLRVLHEVKQKQITQIEAAKRLKISDRHIRRLLLRLRLHSALGYRSPSQQWLKPPRAQLWCSSGVDSGKRKNFLGRGDLTPVPRFPVSWGDRRKIQATANVPKKSVSL